MVRDEAVSFSEEEATTAESNLGTAGVSTEAELQSEDAQKIEAVT